MGRPDLLEALRGQPGGEQLLALAPAGAFLVGGAVRDLLLGRVPRELDVVLAGGEDATEPPSAGDVARLAGELAARLGAHAGGTSEHERFATASVAWEGGRIDIAAARRERYAQPGALPEVEPAPLAEDLLRRDFTVNAIAVALDGPQRGEPRAAAHALEDLHAGRLRVLHERSFSDDPTRLWRLARYRARLGFTVERRTAELAVAAVAAGALATVSGARVGAELRLALSESEPLQALAELDGIGALRALHPRLRLEPALVTGALELLADVAMNDEGEKPRGTAGESRRSADGDTRIPHRAADGDTRVPRRVADGDSRVPRRAPPGADRTDLLMLAALVLPLALRADGAPRTEIAALLDRLEFPAGDRDRVAAAAAAVPALLDALPAARSPSQLRGATLGVPAEGVALAGAVSVPAAAPARRWLSELRHVRLRIGGEDLRASGMPEGPEIGVRLERTLRMRLDGELPDERAAQLRAALAAR
jgi:tRNA nucleotidyltransferase (CCA-adding enzyme)